ncbi:hypothetical protein MKEN_00497000 [Mycena kentingensis (nom. inval.)]|nr:hypothetical protein MKEN_00497000 [Mycena kentingensis (nom. inval.)]
MPRTSLSLSSSVKQNMLTPRVVRSLRKRKSGHGSQTSLTTIPAVAAPTARPLVHTLRRRILKRALRTFPRTSRHAAMRPHWRRRSPADAESTPPNRSFECPLRVRPSSCAYDASRLSSASLPPPLPDSAPLPITLPQLNFPLLALFPETDSGYCSDASPSPALTTATAPARRRNACALGDTSSPSAIPPPPTPRSTSTPSACGCRAPSPLGMATGTGTGMGLHMRARLWLAERPRPGGDGRLRHEPVIPIPKWNSLPCIPVPVCYYGPHSFPSLPILQASRRTLYPV